MTPITLDDETFVANASQPVGAELTLTHGEIQMTPTTALGQILRESIAGGRKDRTATVRRITDRMYRHFEAVSELTDEEIASAMWDGEQAREQVR